MPAAVCASAGAGPLARTVRPSTAAAVVARCSQNAAGAGRAAAGTHDAAALAGLERDLRYWRARKASARPVTVATVPEAMRFGVTATLRAADGATRTITIVGEDEADPARGLVSWVSPAAESLIGAGIGEAVAIGGQRYELIELAAPDATRDATGVAPRDDA